MVRSSRHQQLSALYRVRVISHTEGSIAVMRCFFSCQQGGKQMKKFYRRSISGLLALLICFTTILGSSVTALATSVPTETAKSYSVAFPRNGDANLDTSGTWGHDELHYMNGWTSGEKTWMTTLHTIGDFNGPACYCIEPGVLSTGRESKEVLVGLRDALLRF